MIQNEFRFQNTSSSLLSANYIIEEIYPFFENSVSFIDFGCGLGAWTSVFESKGIIDFKCYDHPSLPKKDLLFQDKSQFYPIDFEKMLPDPIRVDFCICIEVLEHFTDVKGKMIIDYLTSCSDLILFSAAIPNQKGVGHLNEQRHNYWHSLFESKGYQFYDGFKSSLYRYENEIKFFHLQNAFIYYRGPHKSKFVDMPNVSSKRFELIARDIVDKSPSISDLLKDLPRAFARSIKHRFK